MKSAAYLFIALLSLVPAIAAAAPNADPAAADAVEIWDQRASARQAKPVKITDTTRVTALVALIRSAPEDWKRGSFTSPAGELRFVFLKSKEVVSVIGLGHGFLVRGGGGNWESKSISWQLEATLRKVYEDKGPNHTAEPASLNRGGSS